MVVSHPETFPSATQQSPEQASQGRMENHEFFLMRRAVLAYQERYRPKLVTLGLNLIESRILIVLNDFSGLSTEELNVHLLTPIDEAREALSNLGDRGMVTVEGDGYALTDAGKSKTEEIWHLAESHAKETFKRFSRAEVDTFTNILRQLIND